MIKAKIHGGMHGNKLIRERTVTLREEVWHGQVIFHRRSVYLVDRQEGGIVTLHYHGPAPRRFAVVNMTIQTVCYSGRMFYTFRGAKKALNKINKDLRELCQYAIIGV